LKTGAANPLDFQAMAKVKATLLFRCRGKDFTASFSVGQAG
jgi:hypothetical protein